MRYSALSSAVFPDSFFPTSAVSDRMAELGGVVDALEVLDAGGLEDHDGWRSLAVAKM